MVMINLMNKRNNNLRTLLSHNHPLTQETLIEPEVSTVSNLEESLRELVGKCSVENVYVEIPKVNLDTVIISNKKIHLEN